MSSTISLQVRIYRLCKGLVAYIKLTNKIKRTIPKQIFDIYIVVSFAKVTIYSMY